MTTRRWKGQGPPARPDTPRKPIREDTDPKVPGTALKNYMKKKLQQELEEAKTLIKNRTTVARISSTPNRDHSQKTQETLAGIKKMSNTRETRAKGTENQPGASNESHPWETPTKRKISPLDRANKHKRRTLNPVPTNNTFEALPMEGETTETDSDEEDTEKTNDDQTIRNPERSEGQRPPPIHTCGLSLKQLADLLTSSSSITKDKFYLKPSKDVKYISVFPKNIETFNLIKNVLNLNEIRYYSYTPKTDKLKTIVLKGIQGGEYNDKDILKELKEVKLSKGEILKATKTQFKKNSKNYVYLVQLSSDAEIPEVMKINRIAYQKVNWEHLRKTGLFQCKNCQRLGHSSGNCSLGYRCVKCSESHKPGECALNENSDRSQLKCANCGETGHPANYKGCRFYKQTLEKIKINQQNNEQRINERIRKISRRVTPGISFADCLTTNPDPTTQKNIPTHTRNQTSYKEKNVNSTLTRRQDTHTPNTTHLNAQCDTEIVPQWATNLTNLVTNISNKFDGVTDQVEQNKKNIEKIMKHLELSDDQ